MTAARRSGVRSSGARRSILAAIRAWTVSGMRSGDAAPSSSASMRIVSSTNSGLPPVFSISAATSSELRPVPLRSVEIISSTSTGASGSSSIEVARTRPPPQPGRTSRSSGRERQQEEKRRLAHPGGEMLDQLEQGLLRPVDVLEDEDERLHGCEAFGPFAHGPRDLLLAALALHRLEHARGEAEQVGDRLVLATDLQLLDGFRDGVVVRDPCRDLHHLGDRPVRDPLPVGQRATGEDRSRPPPLPGTRARAGSFRRPARRRS